MRWRVQLEQSRPGLVSMADGMSIKASVRRLSWTHRNFHAFCQRGHRIIPSSGEHWTVVETGPGIYEYLTGRCDDLPASREASASWGTT